MKCVLATTLLLSLAMAGYPQTKDTITILPGSKILESNRLSDYSASYDLYSNKDGEVKWVGGLEDHFYLRNNGRALRVCKISFGPNNILDSGLCILQGLIPIYHRSDQTKKLINLTFSREKVNGKIIFKSEVDPKAETIDYNTPSPLFDSFYEDIIAKTIEVKGNVLFRFPEYIYEKGGTVWSLGEVLKGGNSSERIVKFYELNSKKEIIRTTTFVVTKTTHEILLREYQMGNTKIIMKKKQT